MCVSAAACVSHRRASTEVQRAVSLLPHTGQRVQLQWDVRLRSHLTSAEWFLYKLSSSVLPSGGLTTVVGLQLLLHLGRPQFTPRRHPCVRIHTHTHTHMRAADTHEQSSLTPHWENGEQVDPITFPPLIWFIYCLHEWQNATHWSTIKRSSSCTWEDLTRRSCAAKRKHPIRSLSSSIFRQFLWPQVWSSAVKPCKGEFVPVQIKSCLLTLPRGGSNQDVETSQRWSNASGKEI